MIAPALSYRVASYINAVNSLNYRLLVVSNSKHSLISQIASGITIDFTDAEQALHHILEAVKNLKILTVLSTDDSIVTLASQVASHLGLAHNPAETSLLTYRKDLARIRLREHCCNVPDFHICQFDEAPIIAEALHYPVVLKPLMLSGSRGVIRADTKQQFLLASQDIQQILGNERCNDYEKTHFLIESFIPGKEIAFDGFIKNGQLITLALFDKPEPLNGPYFEESYYITPSSLTSDTQQDIVREIEKCCQAYGLVNGPIHAEARINDQGIYLIEMAARTIGGQCAQMIEYVMGTRLEEIVVKLSCEDNVEIKRSNQYAGVLMIPIQQSGVLKRVEGMTKAQQVKYINSVEIHIQPGYELIPLPRGSSYLGFIFAQAPTYNETYNALKSAHQALTFVTTERWELFPQ